MVGWLSFVLKLRKPVSQRQIFTCLALLVAAVVACPQSRAEISFARIVADPTSLSLVGSDDCMSILLHAELADGQLIDVTDQATWNVLDPTICRTHPNGMVTPLTNGETTISVDVANLQLEIPVSVSAANVARPLNFANDIVPILSRFGCNSSACHGKVEGQNGFKLSVFGFDPTADYQALVMEGRGRRVFPSDSSRSLLLTKACGKTPHGGGIRIPPTRPEFTTLQRWIAEGARIGDETDLKLVEIEVSPHERVLSMAQQQRLRVVANWSDGSRRDVTALAQFQSNNSELASVNPAGIVNTGNSPGTVAVMASYGGQVDIFHALIPRAESDNTEPSDENAEFLVYNVLDPPINRRLQQLNITPSRLCTDADFLRRVHIDIIGTLPTAEEAKAFLHSDGINKRQDLVENLLQRTEFADYWALKWSDLLRVNRQALGHKQAYLYYQWIRSSFAENKRLDQFAKELVAAEGPVKESPASHFFKVVNQPNQAASTISQVFLGMRIECAQCHHHPFDRWSQTDYWGMQAFFTQVGFKQSAQGEIILAMNDVTTAHPRTGQKIFAHALGTTQPSTSPPGDRRRLFADWLATPQNPWFSRSLANRAWAHFMGRGVVEPVDDFRLTNPPSNTDLLDVLAEHFSASQFDFQQLVRLITSSAAYQRSAQVNASNENDEQNYSRFLMKQLEAEVLLDAVCQTTGIDEKFEFVPAGKRAIQLWDSSVPHYFLKLFGRPVRASACDCERVSEPTVGQVLHVLNSPRVEDKLAHADGRIAHLVAGNTNNMTLVEKLYLTFFCRFPTETEQKVAIEYISRQANRRQAAEDLAWSMLNSLEFLFNR